ncbi:GDNF family receptor alpha-1-like isoform X2 [Petromyzon marinus]|uniref:GDNF family receptor alpha-1-like isoform X2 n=1 Tax=Petromyzon marinus TaxID=7757 RepID=A0AAJ7TJB9_PETMA|nr:GDNF family receptor alpha-1-like isoform X2 [Petromyzon marinus]
MTRMMMMCAVACALLAFASVLCSVGASHQQQQQQPRQDWVECSAALRLCKAEAACNQSFRSLDACVHGSPGRAGADCMDALMALQSQPIYGCKCKRAEKNEQRCLKIYWTMHSSFEQDDDIFAKLQDTPYIPLQLEGETGLAADDRMDCVEATSACNKNASCQSHRTEFFMKCMRPSESPCDRESCHVALRRFYDNVAVVRSRSLLFCTCSTENCEDRRRLTIMPECSYKQKERPNCLNVHAKCLHDRVCRSRLDDFRMNCAPVSYCRAGCETENYKRCLYAYTGLIGTVMTPNYINTSLAVSPWCTCDGSGNKLDQCQYLLGLFTDNPCLKSAISLFTASGDHGVMGNHNCATPNPHNSERFAAINENETSTVAKGSTKILQSVGGRDAKLNGNDDNGGHRPQQFAAILITLCHLIATTICLSP